MISEIPVSSSAVDQIQLGEKLGVMFVGSVKNTNSELSTHWNSKFNEKQCTIVAMVIGVSVAIVAAGLMAGFSFLLIPTAVFLAIGLSTFLLGILTFIGSTTEVDIRNENATPGNSQIKSVRNREVDNIVFEESTGLIKNNEIEEFLENLDLLKEMGSSFYEKLKTTPLFSGEKLEDIINDELQIIGKMRKRYRNIIRGINKNITLFREKKISEAEFYDLFELIKYTFGAVDPQIKKEIKSRINMGDVPGFTDIRKIICHDIEIGFATSLPRNDEHKERFFTSIVNNDIKLINAIISGEDEKKPSTRNSYLNDLQSGTKHKFKNGLELEVKRFIKDSETNKYEFYLVGKHNGKEHDFQILQTRDWKDGKSLTTSKYDILYNKRVKENPKVLTHCIAGKGRTGTILVIDILNRVPGIDLLTAICFIKITNSIDSIQEMSQLQSLIEYCKTKNIPLTPNKTIKF